MKDLEMAKDLLNKEGLSLVFVKNESLVLKSKDRGIKPLYHIAKGDYKEYEGVVVADKVVGKGAALLYEMLKIRSLYAKVISETAIEFLDNTDIVYSYDLKIPTIMNRDETDTCPIEKMSVGSDSGVSLMEKLDSFFININGGM